MGFPPRPPKPAVPTRLGDSHFHQHRTINGSIVACYHRCKSLGWKSFVIGLTIGYLPEHFLWEKVPPFYYLTNLVGL